MRSGLFFFLMGGIKNRAVVTGVRSGCTAATNHSGANRVLETSAGWDEQRFVSKLDRFHGIRPFFHARLGANHIC